MEHQQDSSSILKASLLFSIPTALLTLTLQFLDIRNLTRIPALNRQFSSIMHDPSIGNVIYRHLEFCIKRSEIRAGYAVNCGSISIYTT